MRRTRNKYRFKWWHAVLGLVGIGVAAGAIRGAASPRGQTITAYRGFTIVIEETEVGFYWSVQKTVGNYMNELAIGGPVGTHLRAVMEAHDAIDLQLGGAP